MRKHRILRIPFLILWILLAWGFMANQVYAANLYMANEGGMYGNCGPRSSNYGDYYGYGPGNLATGGYVAYGSGNEYLSEGGQVLKCPDGYWSATERMINIGAPIPKNKITSIGVTAHAPGSVTSYQMSIYASENGQNWYSIGTVNATTWTTLNLANVTSIPIQNIKYFRAIPAVSGRIIDAFAVDISYIENSPPSPPNIDNIANGQVLNHDNPSICWNFNDPNTPAGDYQTGFQLVGSTTNWASWQYDSGEVMSGNRCFSLPNLGQGDWHFAVRTRDSQGLWSTDWGYLYNVKLDTTRPTYTGHTVSGRKLNSTTFRMEVFGVSDNLSGIKRVQFPTWTTLGGHDDLIWYDGVHAGGGHWYVDIPLSNHGNQEGEYMTHIYVYDYAENSSTAVVNTYIDRTNPTASSITTSGRWLNGTTFRVEAHGVSDNLSGIQKVTFPTWTEHNGQDDLQEPWHNHPDYQGIHAGGGTWYIDIPIDKHSNEEGKYITHVYAWDQAGNQGYLGPVDTYIDRTKATLVDSSITGANYVNGNDYWVKPGQSVITKIRAKDENAGIYRIFHVFTGTNGTTGHSWINYNFLDQLADSRFDADVALGGVESFDVIANTNSYYNGNEAEMTLTLTTKPVTGVKYYNFRYNLVDKAGNELFDTLTGKRVNVDGENPSGFIDQDVSNVTNKDVVLRATGNDGNGSGMKRIRLPSGSFMNQSVATYTVSANGTYTFLFEDNVGNVGSKSIIIDYIDKIAPTITLNPEKVEANFKDIEVQANIADTGGSGFKQARYVWTKDATYPTEGWSEWDSTPNPLIAQTQGGKWYLHMEAEDYAGNISYASGGMYEKIVVSGGPSVNINVFPVPTGEWVNRFMDVYVFDSGDTELLAKAKKTYEVTNSSLVPSTFSQVIPTDKKIPLTLQGENFVHIQYVLDDGTKMSSTAGPYLIDTGAVGDFDMKVTDENGNEVNTWTNLPLKLVMGDPTSSSVSSIQKQYRIEGVHTEWQTYTDGITINFEGSYRIFGRLLNEAGSFSEQKWIRSYLDKSNPQAEKVQLQVNANGTYDVTVRAGDELSSVKEVWLDDGTKLMPVEKEYVVSNLVGKPNSVRIEDEAGNRTDVIAFETEPVITFKNPYTLEKTAYRGEVVAVMEGASSYLIGWKKYKCAESVCEVKIEKNTIITAIKENGKKETRTIVKIDNLEKGSLSFVLNGKRNLTDPTKLEFEWNYEIDEGQLRCTEDGLIKSHVVSGKAFVFVGKNVLYDCYVEGDFGGETIRSNKIMVFANGNFSSEGMTVIEEVLKETNVHIDENSTGDAYMINTKRDNYKKDTFPFPKELF